MKDRTYIHKTEGAEEEQEKEMPFMAHLEELRWRLIRSVISVIILAFVAFSFKKLIFDGILLAPKSPDFITFESFCQLSHIVGLGEALCIKTTPFELINIDMAGQFTSHIIVSLISGIIAAFPYILFQIWQFIKPGLRVNERDTSKGVVTYSSLLFIIGILFGYFVISPISVRFLGTYQVSAEVTNQIRLTSYISTVSLITLAAGILFQLPVVVYFFSKVGFLTPELLKKYRKYALVIVLIISAIITPPDVASQILVCLPLFVLYEISIVISRRVNEKYGSSAN
ncbi:MAG: twin-arginine translocase subunit TatC [Flavobacteriales bacterium]